MKMVAAAKLKRSQDRILAARPYAHKMRGVLSNLSQRVNRTSHPPLQKREGKKIEILVVTSDRGLCGSFNTNIVKAVGNYAEIYDLHFGPKALALPRGQNEQWSKGGLQYGLPLR